MLHLLVQRSRRRRKKGAISKCCRFLRTRNQTSGESKRLRGWKLVSDYRVHKHDYSLMINAWHTQANALVMAFDKPTQHQGAQGSCCENRDTATHRETHTNMEWFSSWSLFFGTHSSYGGVECEDLSHLPVKGQAWMRSILSLSGLVWNIKQAKCEIKSLLMGSVLWYRITVSTNLIQKWRKKNKKEIRMSLWGRKGKD